MADGYALIEFNTEGKGRIKESEWLDIRLTVLDSGADDLFDQLEGQLPKGIKDTLILATFTYESVECGDGFSVEYEDSFILNSHVVLRENYKEFYRIQVTEELKYKQDDYHTDIIFEANERRYKILVENWEEFYDEDFTPFIKPAPVLQPTSLFEGF